MHAYNNGKNKSKDETQPPLMPIILVLASITFFPITLGCFNVAIPPTFPELVTSITNRQKSIVNITACILMSILEATVKKPSRLRGDFKKVDIFIIVDLQPSLLRKVQYIKIGDFRKKN